jgi:hypothetical protein
MLSGQLKVNAFVHFGGGKITFIFTRYTPLGTATG